MKRLATFFLLAGFTQIPLWAGEYFMPAKPVFSLSSQKMQNTGLLSLPPRSLFSSEQQASVVIAPSPQVVTVGASQPAMGLLSMPPKALFSSSQPLAQNIVLAPITAPPGNPVASFMPPKPLFSSAPQPASVVMPQPTAAVQTPIQRVEQTVVVGTVPLAAPGTVGSFMPPRSLFASGSQPTAEHVVVGDAPRSGTANAAGVFMPPKPLLSGPMFAGSTTGGVFMPPRALFSSTDETAYRPAPGGPVQPAGVTGVSFAGPRTLAEIEAAYPVWNGNTGSAVSVYPTPTRPTTFMPPRPLLASDVRPVEGPGEGIPTFPLMRFFSPVRQADYAPTAAPQYHAAGGAMPLPTGYRLVGNEQPPDASYGPYYGQACGPTCSGWGGLFSGRLRAWAFFQPTTRDALPRLQPLPYVGPVLAFRCDGSGGCAVAGGVGCGVGNGGYNCAGTGNGSGGRAGIGMAGRGCREGCVPPADDAIPGYHFGGRPAVEGGSYQQYGSVTSYKPAANGVTPAGATKYFRPTYAPESGVQPAGGDVLSRPLSRP